MNDNGLAEQDSAESRKPRKRFGRLIIIAVMVVLTAAAAFAMYGEEIARFVYKEEITRFTFGGNTARQVTRMRFSDGVSEGSRFAMRYHLNAAADINRYATSFEHSKYQFASVAEAREYVSFNAKEPSFVPEGAGTSSISVPYSRAENAETGEYDLGNLSAVYGGDGNILLLSIFQTHINPKKPVIIQTTFPIEKVMVGDIEAAAIYDDSAGLTLYWVHDSVLIRISSAYDLETTIAVAESMITS